MFLNRFLKLFVVISFGILVACQPTSLEGSATISEPEIVKETVLPPIVIETMTISQPVAILSSTPSTATSQATNTFAPTLTLTSFPTASSTPSITPPPTVQPELEILYEKKVESDNLNSSQVWLFDTSKNTNALLFSTPLGTILHSISQNPLDKYLLYYIQEEIDGQWALWQFNRLIMQTERVTDFFDSHTIGWLGNWSIDGLWVNLDVEDYTDLSYIKRFTWLFKPETGQIITIPSWIVWSPTIPDQFIYEDNSSIASPKLVIGNSESNEFIQTIPLTFNPSFVLWSPDGTQLVADVASGGSGSSYIFIYDFTTDTWRSLLQPEQDSYGPFLSWSPDGTWLALTYPFDIYVLQSPQLGRTPTWLVEMEQRPFIETWLNEPEQIVIRSDNKLWLLDPNVPNKPVFLLNLQTFGIAPSTDIIILER